MPRFVVLEHRWAGVHWDFMLEREPGGLLRTWALDAPIVAGADLPARELADHRPAYLDYEGEVSGGRGTVRRRDRGEYEVLEWTADLVRVRLLGDQLVGVVELRRVVEDEVVVEGPGTRRTWTFRLGNVA